MEVTTQRGNNFKSGPSWTPRIWLLVFIFGIATVSCTNAPPELESIDQQLVSARATLLLYSQILAGPDYKQVVEMLCDTVYRDTVLKMYDHLGEVRSDLAERYAQAAARAPTAVHDSVVTFQAVMRDKKQTRIDLNLRRVGGGWCVEESY